MKIVNLTLFAAALTISGSAQAQEIHYGFNVGMSMPQGDLKKDMNNKIGYTVGFWVPIEFNGGHTIRPRVDFSSVNATVTDPYYHFVDGTHKVTTTTFGADYLYNINGKAGDGFYILAGVGYSKTQWVSDATWDNSSTGISAIAFGVGIGYEFTPMLGAELRYASTHPTILSFPYKNDVINISATFRF